MERLIFLTTALITAVASATPPMKDGVIDSRSTSSTDGSVQALLGGVAGKGSDRTVRKEISQLFAAHDIINRADRANALIELGFACEDNECRISAENRGELTGPNWRQSLTRFFFIRVGYHETPMKIDVKHLSVRKIPDQSSNSPMDLLIYREGPFARDDEFSRQVKQLLQSKAERHAKWDVADLRAAGFQCATTCSYTGGLQVETVVDAQTESRRYRYEVVANITTDPPVVTAKQTQE